MSRYSTSVKFADWDLGCLPGLLQKEMACVERLLRARPDLPPAEAQSCRAYLAQLEGCMKAIQRGRAKALMAARRAGATR